MWYSDRVVAFTVDYFGVINCDPEYGRCVIEWVGVIVKLDCCDWIIGIIVNNKWIVE